jgi:hypothetical protein
MQVLVPDAHRPVGVLQLHAPSQTGGGGPGSHTPEQTFVESTAKQSPLVVSHCSVTRQPANAGEHALSTIDSWAHRHGRSGSVVVVEPAGTVVVVVELVVVDVLVVDEVDGGEVVDVVVVGIGTHW